MGIIMNAFIAIVIKPNITSTGDKTDSRGEYAMPTKRLGTGPPRLHQGTALKSVSCAGSPVSILANAK